MPNTPPTNLENGRLAFFGELLLRLSPPGHELPLQSPTLNVHVGGAEANVARSLAILGHSCSMVSALPDQVLGQACAGQLRYHGVATDGLRYGEGRLGLYFLSPGAMQRPTEVLYDRADSVFARTPAEAYDWPRLLDGVTWLHLSGINLALGEVTANAALAAARAARAMGASVSFDCNYRSKLWGAREHLAAPLLREIVAESDLLFGHDRDVALMLGMPFHQPSAQARFEAAAAAAFDAWPRLAHIAATARVHRHVNDQTLMGLAATRHGMTVTPTYALDGIVDRIGAGDAFAAGFLHGLLRQWDEPATLHFATAAACLKHSMPGDVNLAREADMLALLAEGSMEVKR